MHERLRQQIYDRLAQLARGNEGRLMEHLRRASDTAARQAKLKEQREADGYRRVPIWVHERDLDALRERYPGPRGGVDWGAVISIAKRGGQ